MLPLLKQSQLFEYALEYHVPISHLLAVSMTCTDARKTAGRVAARGVTRAEQEHRCERVAEEKP